MKVGVIVERIVADSSCEEPRIRQWVRLYFASVESGAGLPRSKSENYRLWGLLVVAAYMYFIGWVFLANLSAWIWAPVFFGALALTFWAFLITLASNWERACWRKSWDAAQNNK